MASTEQCEAPQGPGIHIYLFWTKDGNQYLTHQDSKVTAEELTTKAAESVGKRFTMHQSFKKRFDD